MIDVDASPAGLSGHETELAVRSLFVHGFATRRLLVVGWGLSRPLAIAAAALSLMQWGLETAFAAGGPDRADRGDEPSRRREDARHGRPDRGRRALDPPAGGCVCWHRWPPIALVVSAAGYGLLVPSLAAAAFVSLPLLLIWISGSGLSR